MGTTTSGIWYPEPGDTYNEVSTLATMASSIENLVEPFTRKESANVSILSPYKNQGSSSMFRVERSGGRVYLEWGVSNSGLNVNQGVQIGVIPESLAPHSDYGNIYGNAVTSSANISGRFEVRPNGQVWLLTGSALASYYLASTGFSWAAKA